MPVGFLTDDQAGRYGRFAGEPTPDQLARHFHLDDADRAFVAEHRGDHNRLGVAVQLGSVRLLGAFLDDPTEAPASAVRFAADQLSIAVSADLMTTYGASEGRWRHGSRIRERYGYRAFTDSGIAFRLNRFLYALCWTGTDRPSALFDRAVAWLLSAKVLLPGLSVLERAVARVRSRASAHLHRRLSEGVTPEERERLDGLVAVPEGGRQSALDRLRDGPYIQSGPEIAVPSPASARSARSRTDCRKLIVCRPARSQPSRATHQPPKRRPSSGCRMIGAPRRSSPSSARSRPRPGTTSSTCSTLSPPRCSRRPTRPRRRRACARFVTSMPRR